MKKLSIIIIILLIMIVLSVLLVSCTGVCNHRFIRHNAQAPTCEQAGWEAYKICSKCKYTTYKEIPATGHVMEQPVKENVVPATCTEAGSYDNVVYCFVCKKEVLREHKIISAEHIIVEHSAKEPTCTESGWKAYETCYRCDYTTYEEIPAQHSIVQHSAKMPTCTEVGWDAYVTCSRCDYSTYVEIPARHTPKEAEEENYVPAKCTVDGSYDLVVYCEICNHEISRESKTIGKLDHNLVDFPAVQPTCTEKGWSAGKACTRCNATLREEYPALEHDLTHYQAQAPTCTENGWGAYDTCSRCEYTTKVEIPASHNLTHYEAKASTCTEIGWEAYDTCSRCEYSTYNEISEKGHNLSSFEAKDPTCTEIGWDAYDTCSRCDYTTRVIKPAIGHNYGEDGKCATCLSNTYLTFELNDDRQSYKVTGIQENCTPKHLVIPSKINGKAVTTIGEYAFGINIDDLSAKGLKVETLTIPATVTTIEAGAFSVKEAFGIEFSNCVKFDEIYYLGTLEQWCNMSIFGQNIDSSVINSSSISCAMPVISADVMYIDGKPLSGELVIPTSVTSINSWVFYGAKDITNVVLHPGVAYIGEGAFVACLSLTNINIPEGITAIEQFTFYGCKALQSIALPEGIVSIGFGAFYSAEAIETIYLPESLTLVETDAFAESHVKDVYFAGTKEQFDSIVVEEGNFTVFGISVLPSFGSTKHFAKYTQKENVIEATCLTGGSHDLVLYYTKGNVKISSTHVTVPALGHDITHYDEKEPTCTEVGWNAYETCSRCDYSTYNEIPALGYGGTWGNLTWTLNKTTGHLTISGTGEMDDFTEESTAAWREYKDLIKSVTIEDSVTSIGYAAFRGCNNLTSITLPFVGATKDGKENTHFGYIFGASIYSSNSTYVPRSLKEVVITGGTTIGEGAFYHCGVLTSVTFGDECQLTTIGKEAFINCSSLTSITIPDSVTSIGYAAFRDCNNLTSITLPFVGATKDGTENTHFGYIFGASAYSSNSTSVPTNLKEVVITGGATIGEGAFYYCSGLTSVTFRDECQSTTIGKEAFINCTSLTSITIPDSVTSIGYASFLNCSSLTSITLPNSVTTIGDYAFLNCTGLTSITLPNSVTTIGDYAFAYCNSLTSVYYGGTEKDWTNVAIGSYNTELTEAAIYHYSEFEPTTGGKYWHYVDGVATKW